MKHELVIKNGNVIDGTGSPAYQADIRIVNDNITEIGKFTHNAVEELDATGLIVAPGFVDIHSHSDYTLLVDPRAESSVYQGVTTEIIGNCGHGCFPICEPRAAASSIYGYTGHLPLQWHSITDYFDRLEKAKPAVNVATLLPNGQLRRFVSGQDGESLNTSNAMRRMKDLLEEALKAGAWGFSTGLEYAVEQDTTIDEIVELCAIVKKNDGIYATHTRDRDVKSVEAVKEAIETSKRSGVQLQISHLLPRSGADDGRRCVEVVENARRDGIPVFFDQHTRSYGFTFLNVLLPKDLLENGPAAIRKYLADPAKRQHLKRYKNILNSGVIEKWRRIRLLPDKRYPELQGLYFSELARQSAKEPMDIALDLLLETLDDENNPLMVMTDCYTESEQADTFSHSLCVPGSDATALCTSGPLSGSVFPGAYSWASWFYRFMVTDKRILSKEQAIRKLAAEPAKIMGLKRRGELKPGYHADIVIFEPDNFTECITLEHPNRLARGVQHVLVNGSFCLKDGKLTGERNGTILKPTDL